MEEPSTPEQLYALPPEQFTAARDAAAKQAKRDGDGERAKALGALRRPSVPACLVNRLAGERADLLEQLLALGPALAAAQSSGSGEELRALGEQRRQLVEAVVDQAVADAGRPVTPTVRTEVAATLEAALADPASAEAVRSGLLVRALSFAGFGGVDLAGAVATPAPRDVRPARGPDPQPAGRKEKKQKDDKKEQERRRAEEVEAAERQAHAAAGALDDAVRRCEDLERSRDVAQQAASAARQEVERLEEELTAARSRQAEADAHLQQAEAVSAQAVDEVRRAQEAAEQARSALDRLRRG